MEKGFAVQSQSVPCALYLFLETPPNPTLRNTVQAAAHQTSSAKQDGKSKKSDPAGIISGQSSASSIAASDKEDDKDTNRGTLTFIHFLTLN
jgi:hypothetical protein